MKKKKGVTILEVLITITLTAVVFSLIYPIFLIANKNFIKINIQTELQEDSSKIETNISKLLTQSNGIESIVILDNNYKVELNKDQNLDIYLNSNNEIILQNIEEISFSIKDEQNDIYNYVIKKSYLKDRGENKIYKLVIGKKKSDDNYASMKYTTLSENLKDIKIKLNNNTLEKTTNANINIDLYGKKGQVEVNHNINSNITFRNKI